MNFSATDSILASTITTVIGGAGVLAEAGEAELSGDDDFYELTPVELIIWCMLYAIIAFMAVVGNLLVLYITLFRLRVRSITTYFILNLGFADLFTGIFAIPFKFQAALFQEWFLPRSLCRIVPYVETVALTVSVFTLVTSAVHEFRTMFFSKCSQMSPRSAKRCVLLIWIMAVLVSLPHGLFHNTYEFPDDNNTSIVQCLPVYPDAGWWKTYNVYLVIIQYFVPMIILDTAYTMIAVKIWSLSQSRVELDETKMATQKISVVSMVSPNTQLSQLMRTLIIVVACFSLCWFPLETYLLLNELKPEINGWKYINLVFFFSHWLAMSNSCLNPIIYGLYNTKYNEEYRRLFRQIGCIWQRQKSLDDSMKPERRWNSSNDCQDQQEIDQIVDIPPVISTNNLSP
ncbi:G-protein coupled receptors family 1 profile domain-containing protein [Caenorhabditis elegans]|uniref:G-protein coupled receptors family 1 profile domain-containing protein n=1 Tax=Caenorhabditis elegans TaxID=6239 RepID=Q58AU0_CAEEL|nr:G-protein coupled receptors family 1 profile domain-containing protein [Caenorhabditis elegans]CCD61149.2 G-protein coupled receptors family 1 profile domain-containing protein [Caenorhabditis elegans]|eukprot:NP_001343603.1 TachyKinin Receptor family [Caenorhabditis elegans]